MFMDPRTSAGDERNGNLFFCGNQSGLNINTPWREQFAARYRAPAMRLSAI
jgi:hypothetical protein